MINDFTKEELDSILEVFHYARDSLSWTKYHEEPALIDKIHSMIENYRDPNCIHQIDKDIKNCKLCGLPSHSIPCVGGWL